MLLISTRPSATIPSGMPIMVFFHLCRFGTAETWFQCCRTGLRQKVQERRDIGGISQHEYGGFGIFPERVVHGSGIQRHKVDARANLPSSSSSALRRLQDKIRAEGANLLQRLMIV